jgi:DNA polymerase-3 subunit alpha (Gram-positive type)
MQPQEADAFEEMFKKGGYARFQANVYYDDRYSRDLQAAIEGVMEKDAPQKRMDLASVKRVELHCHSKMSEKDAVIDVPRLFLEASRMGHSACALTDHGVVQGFPEAAETYRKINGKDKEKPFKVIYGMEGYLIDDGPCIAFHANETDTFDDGYVAVDVETTGLDCTVDALLEIGAVHFIMDESGSFVPAEIFHTFVNPGRDIPQEITKLTGITPFDVEGSPEPLSAVKAFAEFLGDRPICGHNAMFDLSFIRAAGFMVDIEKHLEYRVKFNPITIDTVELARVFYPDLPNAKLATVADYLKIPLVRAHRADSDAMTCGIILSKALRDFDLKTPDDLNVKAGKLDLTQIVARKQKVYHIILLAKNALGLYHMYRMVSDSHTKYYRKRL